MSALKKLILVEDDSFDAEMTIRSLKQIPLANEIIWLETGAHLLTYLEENGTKEIAVVILDLQMPQVTGIEALQIIREKDYPDFPIVILTSSKEAPDIKKCYELGINSFITKPVKHEEFQKVIKTMGLYWGIINQPPIE
ncbi:MAG: response regulator [Bacteroidota bacterium]